MAIDAMIAIITILIIIVVLVTIGFLVLVITIIVSIVRKALTCQRSTRFTSQDSPVARSSTTPRTRTESRIGKSATGLSCMSTGPLQPLS